jgi:hypothetical protein
MLLAPNGQPSNLTPEQYELVRTPAFKEWFGDWEKLAELKIKDSGLDDSTFELVGRNVSKIVNENGEPLVCFHGTIQDFFTFEERTIGMRNDEGFYGRGFYFTFQKNIKDFKYSLGEAEYYGDRIIPAFIKATNPFDFSLLSKYKGYNINYVGTESFVFLANLVKYFPSLADKIVLEKEVFNKITREYDIVEVSISVLPTLIEKYSKDLKIFVTDNEWGERNQKSGYVKSEIVEYDNTSYGGKKGSYESFDQLGRVNFSVKDGVQYPSDEEIEILLITEAIEKYDGIKPKYQPEGYMTRNPEITDAIREKHDCILQGETGDELVVFESTQIKLADGMNTTFDSNNPDIRYKDGGLTHSLNQSMNNITKNGIVITDEKSGIMAILYNTGNQSRKLGLYNTSLLYKTISEIDKDAASRIVVNINQGVFDEFDKDNIGKYKNSKTLLILNQNEVLYNSNNPDMRYAKGGKTKKSGGGDCYYVAGNMAMDFFNRTKYEGTPYLVHAEVQGQGNLADIRYGHAWVEDDVNVYDNSNLRHLVIPKKLYYKIGDIKTDNPKKYRKYTFAEAKKKMLETGNYGCWDIETDYEDGGEMEAVYEKLGFTEKEIKDWKDEHSVNQRQIRNPKVMQSAILLSQGKITQDEYLEVVRENQPIKPFKEVPKIPTLLEIVGALKSNQIKTGIVGYTKFIEDGEYVASRLDINAYTDFDIWVVSVHEGLKEGNSIGYGQTAYLKNVNFVTSPKVGLNIAVGRSNKTTFARIKGNWVNKDPKEVRDMAVKYMSDKNWVQVGMNPFRHSWFYDKRDGMPLLNAEEIIQVGALVLAKNPLKTTPDNPLFIADKNNPDIKFKKGGEIKINEIVLYYEKNGNFLIPKGTFYAWLYDDPTAVQKINSGEWDFVMFPMTTMSAAFQRGYIPPLLRIWDKKFQKDKKGIEHLLGIVQGYYDDKEGKLYLEMMTTNPKHRREGINANIIRQLREEFKVSQDDVVFVRPTKMGENFIASKQYEDGGSLDSNTQLARELAEEELYKIECLECDGSTRVLHYVFTKNGVEHKVMQGSVKISKNKIIPLHFWIELPDGNIVDYKSRMWLGNDVDEGIFKPKKNTYVGKEINLPMNETLYQILSMQNGGVFKTHKSIEEIAKEKNVSLDYAKKQLAKGIKVESEHSKSVDVQKIIALQHLDEMIDYYDKLKNMEVSNKISSIKQKYAIGGTVKANGKTTNNAKDGGFFEGKSHAEGGIKAVNVDTKQPIEVEGNEVIINKRSVADDTLHNFNGKKMTNRQILSEINQAGGGVAFKDGGKTDCGCNDNEYEDGGNTTIVDEVGSMSFRNQYDDYEMIVLSKELEKDGGRIIKDRFLVSARNIDEAKQIATDLWENQYSDETDLSIVKVMSESLYRLKYMDNFADGGEMNDRYSHLSSDVYEKGGSINDHELNETEKHILSKLDGSTTKKCEISNKKVKDIKGIEKKGIVYTTPSKEGKDCFEVRLTDFGAELLEGIEFDYDSTKFAKGGEMDCGCHHTEYREGGATDVEVEAEKKYFQGIDFKYKNQFEVNKAIEELIDSKDFEEFTPSERNFIGYYAGYGGLQSMGAKGKGLLYEYFTPTEIAKKMWGLAYKYGFKGGKVLEPSCGIGEFIKYAPDQEFVTGYEINKTSAKICKVLFPKAIIESKYFETFFIKNNNTIRGDIGNLPKFSLIIGNPPYGSMGGIYAGMGEKSYSKSNNYIEYFITRGLDLLESGGLLIYIIGTEVAAGGTPFLQQPMSAVKKIIAEKSELLDAYRLPNGLFETTDVVTDIIVLKKK